MTITKIQNNLHNLLPLCMVLAISFFFVSKINAQVCGNTFNLETLRRTNSNVYQEHIRIEKIIVDYQKLLINNANARLINDNGVITIPVVFHILHKGEPVGTGTNISDAQIISQMAVLNQCYSQTNDQSAIPQVFRNKAGNPNFQFELACTDPNGYATNGILRRSSSTNFQKYSENIKHTNLGGDDAWQTDRFLNIWVASNLDEDLVSRPLAYATYPEFLVSKPNEDGIVIKYNLVGLNASNLAGYTGGRALVHEIGHWLSVIHPFDGGGCSGDGDSCEDTPRQNEPTYATIPCSEINFPYQINTCGNSNPDGIMYDNFMDYTNDQCGSRMFTQKQVNRMRATFQPGGPRRSFIDNYFKLYKVSQTCTGGIFFVQTPFCAADVNWSITSPATVNWSNWLGGSHLGYVTIPNDVNGEIEITASWSNYTDSKKFMVGYGLESSTYNPNYYNSGNRPLTNHSVSMTSYNNWTYGQVNFSEATGPAKNWRLASSSSPTYISTGTSNSFSIYLTQPYAFATIQADIPTSCGDRTVEYSFLGGYLNMAYGFLLIQHLMKLQFQHLLLVETPITEQAVLIQQLMRYKFLIHLISY